MKNDPSFVFTAAIILAGVVAAFAGNDATPAVKPVASPASLNAPAEPPVAKVAPAGRNATSDAAAHPRHWHRHSVEKT